MFPVSSLHPGASFTCSFSTTFESNGPASQSDVVTASGTDDDDNPVSDSAGATVRITDVPSSIAVTKTPSVGVDSGARWRRHVHRRGEEHLGGRLGHDLDPE